MFDEFKGTKRIHSIWNGDPSHTSPYTREFLKRRVGWVQVLVAPAHTSKFNGTFTVGLFRPLPQMGSWPRRQHLIQRLETVQHESSRLLVHPFTSKSFIERYTGKYRVVFAMENDI